MAQENQYPLGNGFWEFVRSMDNLGIDHTGPPPPPAGAHPPPPPHSHEGRPGHRSHPPPPPPPGAEDAFGFPFDGPHGNIWGLGGDRGRHGGRGGRGPRAHGHGDGHRHRRSLTPSRSRSGSRSRSESPGPRPEGLVAAREEDEHERPSSSRGERGPHPHWGGRRGHRSWARGSGPPPFGPWGPGGGGWGRHGHGHGPHPRHRGPPGPPPPAGGPGPAWDPAAFASHWASHPFVANLLQNLGSQFNPQRNGGNNNNDGARNANNNTDSNGTHTPPTDIFTTSTTYTLHISLPGAKKEDIGVHYAATTSTLTISGVIYRPGNEEFLATMTSSERSVGMFEKNVVLKGDDGIGGEVDGDGITAKLEDGLLVVTVPRIEKEEWEDVKRVDIE